MFDVKQIGPVHLEFHPFSFIIFVSNKFINELTKLLFLFILIQVLKFLVEWMAWIAITQCTINIEQMQKTKF